MPHHQSPLASEGSIVHFGCARFTVLTARIIRLEWALDRVFEDRPSFMVCNRRLLVPDFDQFVDDNRLTIQTDFVKLEFVDDGQPFHEENLRASILLGDSWVPWHFGKEQSANLKGTCKTLDQINGGRVERWVPLDQCDPEKPVIRKSKDGEKVFQGDWIDLPLCDGLLSRDGWAYLDDSSSVVLDPSVCDWQAWPVERPEGERRDGYLLAHGRDYVGALQDGSLIFGRQPLPPRYAFGYWYSRYWAYTDKEIEDLVREFDNFDIPLDVLVVDMDWHLPGWTGYTWDERYFPDYREFLSWLKQRDLKISLNLHPADGVFSFEKAFPAMCRQMGIDPEKLPRINKEHDPVFTMNGLNPDEGRQIPLDVCDPVYMKAYFECLHRPYEKEGVDFWWMDWQQGNQGSALPSLDTLPWINELHWQDQVRNQGAQKRPLNFSRFGGLGAGRMPVGFSGDTVVSWESLAYQPYFTATASNVLFGYWSHDIGGHLFESETSPELYARWMQFGLYSPILRTHTSKDPRSERRFTEYPNPYREVLIDSVKKRYALVPYIYTEAWKAYCNGVSICRPMYYHHPEDAAAYSAPNQYYFGDNMIVAPVVRPSDEAHDMAPVEVWLPKGKWLDLATGDRLEGDRVYKRHYLLNEVPVFVRPGAVWIEQTPPKRLSPGGYLDLVLQVCSGGDGEYSMYEDDGVSPDYRDGNSVQLHLRHRQLDTVREVELLPVEGEYDGFVAKRRLSLRVQASAPPSKVTVNGQELSWVFRGGEGCWHYDGASAGVLVELGEVDLNEGIKIRLDHSQGFESDSVFGFKGWMSRLERIRYLNCLVSPWKPAHPQERFPVQVAQAGNRISRDPARFLSEMKQFRADLERLPQEMEEYQIAFTKRYGRDIRAVETIQKARTILDLCIHEALQA